MTNEERNYILGCGGGICPNCDDVEMDQIEEGGLMKFLCPECGYKVDCSEYEYEGDYYVDPDEEYIPGGCVACGNPAYPDCMTSCSRFDD